MNLPHKDAKFFVAGHAGLIGSALVRRLNNAGYANIVTRSRRELELQNADQVAAF